MPRSATLAVRLWCSIAVALLLALAIALYDYHPVQADGTFVVNSTLDSNSKDAVLTLREAILVANGSLFSGLSDGEKSQLGGCIFSGSADNWAITGGCGTNLTDTITFAFTNTVITLTNPLPSLNDTRPTTVQGPNNSTVELAIDGSSLTPGNSILNILSAGNSVEFLTFRHAPAAGLSISGDNNQIQFGRAYGNGGAGIVLTSSTGTWIHGTQLGFRDLDLPFACSAATRNGGPNLLLTAGTTAAAVDSIVSVCSPSDGVLITGTTTLSNVLRYGYHGTWLHDGGLRFLGNAQGGIAVRGGSDANRITGNTLGNNQDGIVIAGTGTSRNEIQGNDIGRYILAVIANSRHGILIDGGATATDVLTNTVSGNAQSGIVISSTLNNSALVQGNSVFGQGANGIALIGGTSGNTLRDNDVYANAANGILLTGTAAANNIRGGALHENGGAGLAEGGSSALNLWAHLSVYGNGGLGIDKRTDGLPTGPFPIIGSYIRATTGITVSGTASPTLTVELYRVATDPSRYGEGKTYVGEAVADANGLWQIADPAGPGCYTALMNGVIFIFPIATEFALDTPCVFLPAVMR